MTASGPSAFPATRTNAQTTQPGGVLLWGDIRLTQRNNNMKVVFIEDVPGTAKIGDIKDVKPGFARNYLLPRRMAMPASPSVVKSAELRARREERLQDARDMDARKVAERLDGVAYTITARSGSSGKLFGSVGTNDIAEQVSATLGIEFDRHNVLLAEPIKDLGDYPVVVKLTKNVTATVNISVVGEDGTTAADIAAKASGGKKPRASASADDEPSTDGAEPSDDSMIGADASVEVEADVDTADEADEADEA